MSLLADNHITASDFNALKKKISDECNRRQYKDKLSKISLADKKSGDIINDTDIETILAPLTVLDAFPGSLNTSYISSSTSETTVQLSDMDKKEIKSLNVLNTILTNVSNWSDPHRNSNASNSDCRGSCAGLCFGCQGTCDTSCTGGCKGGCSGCTSCSGCSGCSGSCKGSCKGGCSGSCSGCTGGCSGCKGTCEGSCQAVCHNNCGYGCMDTGGNSSGWRCSSND